ncbi:VCBS repeat-containing protein [Flavilitoribacter nigricans]|nr:VCBS repeat-containing protein [Flavilitoribacter nigricans]
MSRTSWRLVCFFGMLLSSCGTKSPEGNPDTLFTLMGAKTTGIDFENTITYDKDFNIYTYRNFYNGGGVAIGDINNDSLPDIYFTSNQGANQLYLNKGDFRFENITDRAGVAGTHAWSTGVVMVDINGDGLLDIYVSNSGDVEGDDKQNELFINQGDLTFTSEAESYGLADEGLTTQTAFFDYDQDGDLDAYVLNNSFRPISSFNLKNNERVIRDPVNGDKLYENRDGHFYNVSDSAGIYGSIIGFGLGILTSDLNGDGWLDIYVCNDFFERDYIYMNNRDGTFSEQLTQQMRSTSMASMGVDIADLNDDGYPEVFVTEMLPKDEARLKTSMTFENWAKYRFNHRYGYHHQFTRNMLHINSGPFDTLQDIAFTEQGRLRGVEASDWSWGALLADLDLDGHKDLYITNGVYKDILNQDYLRYISSDVVIESVISGEGVNYQKLIDIIPSQPISNVAYAGSKEVLFTDKTREWGLEVPGFSNGVAYGDLDNDGDLDLIVNNVNMPAFVYQNQSRQIDPERSYLKIKLRGPDKNTQAIGARVLIRHRGESHWLEQVTVRGFQSSVDDVLTYGSTSTEPIDSLVVFWPDGREKVLTQMPLNQTLYLNAADGPDTIADDRDESWTAPDFAFQDRTTTLPDSLLHRENEFSDFDRNGMLFHMLSTQGPKIAVADINGDGREDLFLCGAKDAAGKLYLQNADGRLSALASATLDADRRCEDVDALFFDADNDGDQDLYVASGGNEYVSSSSALSDRLYLNDGRGNFTKSPQLLPVSQFESTSNVTAADFDKDGDMDLFVGIRLKDRMIGIPQNGYLLENDGQGDFTEVSSEIAPGLQEIGLITDAAWTDIDGDDWPDLIVVGEWMQVEIFRNQNGQFSRMTEAAGLDQYRGWWNTVAVADLDGDGDSDLVLGNHGLNSRFEASSEKPVSCYVNDFDQNGTIEQVICTYNGADAYPLTLRHDLTTQMPGLKKQFLKYEDYKLKKIEDIFSKDQLAGALVHSANFLQSAVAINDGNGHFHLEALPLEAQVAPVYAIHITDLNTDGIPDLLLGGNLLEVKPEVGPYDASFGTCLLGRGDGTFRPVANAAIGLKLEGQVRDLRPFRIGTKELILVGTNNARVQALETIKANRLITAQ